jgi:hypothetical protein
VRVNIESKESNIQYQTWNRNSRDLRFLGSHKTKKIGNAEQWIETYKVISNKAYQWREEA